MEDFESINSPIFADHDYSESIPQKNDVSTVHKKDKDAAKRLRDYLIDDSET